MKTFALLVMALLVACGKQDSSAPSGPARVQLTFAAFVPIRPLGSAKFCVKRLRFGDRVAADFSPVLLELDTKGSQLQKVTLPSGAYDRVELDLEKECVEDAEHSVEGENPEGAFSSDEAITLRFLGKLDAR